jgi:hypothetical protein
VAPPEPAALASLWGLGVLGVPETLELDPAEFESPDDPQPASASAATASAREILALAVTAGFVMKRLAILPYAL